MRVDYVEMHRRLSRRDALGLAAAAGVVAVGLGSVGATASAAAPVDRGREDDDYDDAMFDVAAVIAGAWAPSRYGPDDQRGSFNELTPERAGKALDLLKRGRPVKWYQLGEELFNGFPAFPATPPRLHEMYLYVLGYEPPAGFVDGGGILAGTTPIGPNLLSAHEERFAENYTFQIATQLDGLGHVGVGDVFYNGFRGADLASPTGLRGLGNETMGPVITRAVIYDVVGLKIAQGATADLSAAPNGQPVLRDDYRITIEDLRACLDRQRVRHGIGPGEVPILHTGWNQLVRDDPARYLAQEPGIFLAEVRWFADRRPAIIASDTWGLEVLAPAVTGGNAFPCHQELLGKHGIRIGETYVTDAAIADNVFEGVLVLTPQNVPGATCGSTPPVLLGQPGRRPRD